MADGSEIRIGEIPDYYYMATADWAAGRRRTGRDSLSGPNERMRTTETHVTEAIRHRSRLPAVFPVLDSARSLGQTSHIHAAPISILA